MDTNTIIQSGTQADGQELTQAALQPQGTAYPSGPSEKRRRPSRKKKVIKNILAAVISLAVIGGLVWFSYKVFFSEPPEYYLTGKIEIWPEIKNEVTGYGYLAPAKSETVNITQQGNVLESYAFQGMMVGEGDILAVIDSSVIDKTIEDKNKDIQAKEDEIEGIREQIADVREELAEKNADEIDMRNASRMYAPFAGQIIEAVKYTLGEEITKGTKLGRLVDNSQMRLTLYFSYGYENDIYVGQSCEVSVPAVMASISGKVTGIEKIRRIGADGAVTFEVEILMDNPGSLFGGMAATASLKAAGGESILPAEAGTLEYARELVLTAESEGPLKEYHIRDYYAYQQGDLLMAVDYKANTDLEKPYLDNIEVKEKNIANIEQQIETIREAIAEEMEKMEDLTVKAPISGTITFTNLEPGMKITETAFATVNIAQLQSLTMQAYIGQNDIHSFKVGMQVDVLVWTQNGETAVKGTITDIDTSAKQEGNWAQYPATITVDNSMGMIMDGSSGSFSAKLAYSENAIVVPIQAVKNPAKSDYVYLKPQDGKRPENAVDLSEGTVPEGFYAIPVKCGITNGRYIEIKEGLLREWEGWEIFTQKTDIKPSETPEPVYDGDNTDPNYVSGYNEGYAKAVEELGGDSGEDGSGDGMTDDGSVDGGYVDGGFVDGGMDIGMPGGDEIGAIPEGSLEEGAAEAPVEGGDSGEDSEEGIGEEKSGTDDGESSGTDSAGDSGGAVVEEGSVVVVPGGAMPMPAGRLR